MECMDPGRGSRSTVLERIQYPFGMTAFGKNIYYTDWQRFDFYFKNVFSNSAFLNREKKKKNSYSWSLFINEIHWCCSTQDTGFLLLPVIQCVKAEEIEGRLKVKNCPHSTTAPLNSLWQGSDAPTLKVVELPPHVSGSVSYLFLSDCRKKKAEGFVRVCMCVYVCVLVCT